jgi:hypothetical protein
MLSERYVGHAHKACLSVLAFSVVSGAQASSVAAPAPARSENDDLPGDSASGAAPAGDEAAASAAGPPPAAADRESPVPPRRVPMRIHVPPPSEDETPMWLRHPGSGLTFDFGGFGGGTDLVMAQLSDGSTETLSAGSGVFLSVGGIWTPIWLGDAVGFGVGGYAGLKYDSVGASNASVSLTRFPLGGGAHALIRISERWFLFLRGGIQKEFGVSLSGSGAASGGASMEGSLGGLGEGGFYYVSHLGDDHTAVLFSFRYTSGHDTVGYSTFDAASAGVIIAIHYNL